MHTCVAQSVARPISSTSRLWLGCLVTSPRKYAFEVFLRTPWYLSLQPLGLSCMHHCVSLGRIVSPITGRNNLPSAGQTFHPWPVAYPAVNQYPATTATVTQRRQKTVQRPKLIYYIVDVTQVSPMIKTIHRWFSADRCVGIRYCYMYTLVNVIALSYWGGGNWDVLDAGISSASRSSYRVIILMVETACLPTRVQGRKERYNRGWE